jgi:hypothetical protein
VPKQYGKDSFLLLISTAHIMQIVSEDTMPRLKDSETIDNILVKIHK